MLMNVALNTITLTLPLHRCNIIAYLHNVHTATTGKDWNARDQDNVSVLSDTSTDLSFFFCPLCCPSFDLRLLITPLVSSSSSCPFVLFPLAIVLPVLLRFTVSDYPFGIFRLFLDNNHSLTRFAHNVQLCLTYCRWILRLRRKC